MKKKKLSGDRVGRKSGAGQGLRDCSNGTGTN